MFARIIRFVLVVCALTMTGCVGCGADYSGGDRTGTVTKLSRTGLVRKSWEGELLLGGMTAGSNGATVANVWAFHASGLMAAQIQQATAHGERVRLHYRQWAMSPMGQDSDYDVTSVDVVTPAP